MINSRKFDSEIDRETAIDLDGETVYLTEFEDDLSQNEWDEIKIRLWNDFVFPELEQIFRELDPSYDQTEKETATKWELAKQFKATYEFYRKKSPKVIKEWVGRYATYRHIDGYFYQFRFGRGFDLFDCFCFRRFMTEKFAPQVQHWIEGDFEIINLLEKKLKRAQIACTAFGFSLLIAAIVLLIRYF
ncbi:hypothetical protein KA005_09160 [bacterium]|nr:hypothetical protein [bacterium]